MVRLFPWPGLLLSATGSAGRGDPGARLRAWDACPAGGRPVPGSCRPLVPGPGAALPIWPKSGRDTRRSETFDSVRGDPAHTRLLGALHGRFARLRLKRHRSCAPSPARPSPVGRVTGRELCALARVNMSEAPGNPNRSSHDGFPVPCHQPTRWRLRVRVRPAEVAVRRSSEIRASARRSKRQALCSGRSSPRPRDRAACCRGRRAPAIQRRSLWLDQASARRALAVPPRGSNNVSATAATSSRCSPEPPVRSRRLPGAAA